jgi:endothelin-converting enzyme/putative endopeptidase
MALPGQRFFLATLEGGPPTLDQSLLGCWLISTYPLAKFRVNGPVSNLPQFAAAFQCKAGDAMARADKDRCQILVTTIRR